MTETVKPERVKQGVKQQQAAAMVLSGCTYQETADALGMTRSAVAGACRRAGVKVGRSRPRNPGLEAARKAAIKRWWTQRRHRVQIGSKLFQTTSIASSIASTKTLKD